MPAHVNRGSRRYQRRTRYLLKMHKVVIANEAMDLAQPFADFVKHDRRLDAREDLIAVSYCRAYTASPAKRPTVTAVKTWSSRFQGGLECRIYPRMRKETRTKVSAKAVITAIKPPWFVFDMNARGALTPGVGVAEGAEAGADILGYGEGKSRFGKHKCQMRDVQIVVLILKIGEESTVGRGGNAQLMD